MEFNLHTYEIQDIVIALICNDSSVLKEKPEVVERLIQVFGDMNSMCRPENDFTLTVKVSA